MKKLEWYEYEGAVKIDLTERDLWADNLLKYMEAHPEEDSRYIASGDTMIVAFRFEDGRIEINDVIMRRCVEILKEGA